MQSSPKSKYQSKGRSLIILKSNKDCDKEEGSLVKIKTNHLSLRKQV